MENRRIIEVLLLEAVVFLVLWLTNDYLALILSLIIGGIALSLLVFALVAELLERSKVPRYYYILMAGTVIVPLLMLLLFMFFNNGQMEWLND